VVLIDGRPKSRMEARLHILTVASRKGGAGKTMVTSLLGVEAERVGAGPVCLIDADPMRGLTMWWNRRVADTPVLVAHDNGLVPAIAAAAAHGAKLLIIDTAPHLEEITVEAVARATLVLIPVRPSPQDLWAVGTTVEMAKRAGVPFLFVINAVKHGVSATAEAAIALSEYGQVAKQTLYDRTAYGGTAVIGQTAPERDPSGKAADEARGLWECVIKKMVGGGNEQAAAA